MGIRIAERADVEAMRLIYAPYVEHTAYSYEYEAPDHAEFLNRFERCTAQFPWLVWEENGEVLGYVYASPAFTRRAYGFLADLSIYLREDVRGKGIGRRLYQAAEEILRRQGYCRIYCIITSANTGSLLFHEAMGYRRLVTFARSGMKFGRWYDTIWYEKILRESDEALPFPVSWREVRLDDLFS